MAASGLGFSPAERAALDRDGYVVRRGALPAGEVARVRAVVEEVVHDVATRAQRDGAGPEARLGDGHRIQFSSRTAIQWEWLDGSRQIRLIEPCAHLAPELDALYSDPRVVDPMRDVVGCDAIEPFTSKCNLKRAVEGSEFPWHQDYPYWYVATQEHAGDVATAMLFLDDASAGNGALRVLPGSHRRGPAPRNPADPTRFLADPARIDDAEEVVLEVPAGSMCFFGAYLLHRSSPNRSGEHRRALLYSFQPAGRPRLQALPWRPELVELLP